MVSIADLLKLTRQDLKTFSNETVNLIMQMQDEGWKGHKNNQGHVKMMAPDGETVAMATSNINAHKYLKADYDQYNKRVGKPVVEEKPKEKQKWKCARPNCPKTYITEEKLNYHINVEHEGKLPCPEYPECEEMFDRPASLGLHRARKHGYVSPERARRLELAAEKKGVLEDIRRNVEKLSGDVLTAEEAARGVKFDPSIIADRMKNLPTQPILDVMPVSSLIGEVGRTSLKGLPLATYSSDPDGDKWDADISTLKDKTIDEITTILNAVGMEMEIRVWRKK